MTAIRGFVGASRRPGMLGVHSMDSFNMVVPNLQQAKDFYGTFGMDVREEGNSLGLYTFGHAHRRGSLSEGASKKLSYLSFGVFDDDFEGFRKHVEGQGVKLIDPPAGLGSNGFWFRDHDGVLVEIRVAEKTSPNSKSETNNLSVPANQRGASLRSQARTARPRRLAHLLIFTRDVDQAVIFYARTLGLRLSDRSGDGIALMHGIHGSDHHLIAFVKSDGPGLHHCSWDVGSIEEIGLGAMQVADKGFSKGWGLGRHVLGSNFFHYVRDPWGSYSEYSSDIDYVSADHDWDAGDHAAEDAFYIWGPTPPDDFTVNYENSAK
ncbi:VOC family protein [Mesorhizobium sp. WSM3860]|uniref:VOC family protein n=1 Tax=Mesorhizobium sp. WSM3860 TaxID=2029403 RepID=UPI000BAF0C75|nr:VOC family protein [Mesorhizobium sp. WSM3860]PBC04264.1 metapyrocatechase [Mesorhizobium sp. WSM3860]